LFTKDDVAKFNAFKKVLDSGEFKIKGDAGLMIGVLFKWFADLGQVIEKDANTPKKIQGKITKPKEENGDK